MINSADHPRKRASCQCWPWAPCHPLLWQRCQPSRGRWQIAEERNGWGEMEQIWAPNLPPFLEVSPASRALLSSSFISCVTISDHLVSTLYTTGHQLFRGDIASLSMVFLRSRELGGVGHELSVIDPLSHWADVGLGHLSRTLPDPPASGQRIFPDPQASGHRIFKWLGGAEY